VLKALARERPAGVEVVLLTTSHYQSYSGMLPGRIAGHYDRTTVRSIVALGAVSSCSRRTDRIVSMELTDAALDCQTDGCLSTFCGYEDAPHRRAIQ
jgi:hypothetical protein